MPNPKRITLSFRLQNVGGEAKSIPTVSDEAALSSAQHVVLLIHGYNNDHQDAVDAYNGFHARQQDADSAARYGMGRTFVEVYWPGDAAWGMVSALFYMNSINRAQTVATALAVFLAARFTAGSVRIDIVAHSMGCRLSLELLRALEAFQPMLDIGRMVLMAGAVPTNMLVDENPARRLRPAYDRVLREGVRSLYSGSDMVLAWAFPAGQTLAGGEEGGIPTALGHAFWVDHSVPLNMGQVENPSSGHGDYWGWNTQVQAMQCAQKAAEEVRGFLQFPSAGSRNVSARPLVESSALEARETAKQREIFIREMDTYWPEY